MLMPHARCIASRTGCSPPALCPPCHAPQIAIEMLESGKVDAVVCVQSDESDRFTPKPVGARDRPAVFKPLAGVPAQLAPAR